MKLDDERSLGIETRPLRSVLGDERFVTHGIVLERRELSLWRRAASATSVVLRDPVFVIDPDTGNS